MEPRPPPISPFFPITDLFTGYDCDSGPSLVDDAQSCKVTRPLRGSSVPYLHISFRRGTDVPRSPLCPCSCCDLTPVIVGVSFVSRPEATSRDPPQSSGAHYSRFRLPVFPQPSVPLLFMSIGTLPSPVHQSPGASPSLRSAPPLCRPRQVRGAEQVTPGSESDVRHVHL